MPRNMNLSQLRALQRRLEAKQRQQVQQTNNAIRQHNSKVRQAEAARKRAIDAHNREVRQYNSKVRQAVATNRRAIDAYNRDVRAHNTRVRANQARHKAALQRLAQQPATVRYTTLRRSVTTLTAAYDRLDRGDADPFLSDLAEQEAANSATVLNSLLGDTEGAEDAGEALNDTVIAGELAVISPDLDQRWRGALFALNPENPDAARQFCTSTREIVATILDTKAPDAAVLTRFPDCDTTEQGRPTRRAKVHYCLDLSGAADDALEGFIDDNIENVITLFGELNSGTHGRAGKFSHQQLAAIKIRVEDAIRFMCQIVT